MPRFSVNVFPNLKITVPFDGYLVDQHPRAFGRKRLHGIEIKSLSSDLLLPRQYTNNQRHTSQGDLYRESPAETRDKSTYDQTPQTAM